MPQSRLRNIHSMNASNTLTATPEISDEVVLQTVFRILKHNLLCSIATVTPQNRAHGNTAYFCYSDELELYFLSHPDSLHSWNLLTNSSMAITIFSSLQNWTDPGEGLQLFGTCIQAGAQKNPKAERLYAQRFPAYSGWRHSLKQGDLALAYRFYEFLAEKIKILDEKRFGDAVFVCADVNR